MKNEDNKDFITMFINFESKLKAQDQKSIDMTVKQIIELSTNPIIMDNLSFFCYLFPLETYSYIIKNL